MKKKVDIEQVEFTANAVGIDQEKTNKLVKDLRQALEQEAEQNEKKPREKRQLVIVANVDGKTTDFVEDLMETPMSVVEFPEDGDHNEVINEICKAAYDFNANNKKGQKNPVRKIFEALEVIAKKHFDTTSVKRKNKEPLIVVTTDNNIPTEEVETE